LRFKEFEGEWVERRLGEVATFINGRAYKQEELFIDGKYPVLRVGNLFSNSNWYYSDLELGEDKFCYYGDLLYAWSASFGPTIWEGNKTIFHYHIWKVLPKHEIDKKYLFYVLDNQTLKMKTKSSNGFALLHITKGTIENWDVLYPSILEQTKIADFLSLIDERISTQSKIIRELRLLKSVLTKKILSQQLRFKDSDWKKKKLGELVKIYSGQTPSQYTFDVNGKYAYLKVEDLNNSNKYQSESRTFSNQAKGLIDALSVIFPKRGAAIMTNKVRINCNAVLMDTNLMALTPYRNILNHEYLYYIITHEKLFKIADTSSIPQINNKHIIEYTIMMPLISEQINIANFLSKIDEKIELEFSLLTQHENQKKYLLHNMFI
jgi:type I restriction enzyme S subunit